MNGNKNLAFHGPFLAGIAEHIRCDVYAELGVNNRQTFNLVQHRSRQAYGCDIKANDGGRGSRARFDPVVVVPTGKIWYETNTAEFIKTHLPALPKIDLCFIDADHSCEAVEADFEGVLPYMVPNGIIALHDTFPGRTRSMESGQCGDAWAFAQALVDDERVESFTMPVPPGLTLCRVLCGEFWRAS